MRSMMILVAFDHPIVPDRRRAVRPSAVVEKPAEVVCREKIWDGEIEGQRVQVWGYWVELASNGWTTPTGSPELEATGERSIQFPLLVAFE
jgi:hypothetical protein